MASRVSPWSGTFQTRANPDGAGRDDKGCLDRWGGAHLPLPLSLSCPWGLCGTCLVEHQAGEMLCILHMVTEGWWRLPTVQSWLPVCEWGTCHVHQLRGAETRHCSSPWHSSTETPSGTDHTLNVTPCDCGQPGCTSTARCVAQRHHRQPGFLLPALGLDPS